MFVIAGLQFSFTQEVALRVSHSYLMSSDRMKPRSGEWTITIGFFKRQPLPLCPMAEAPKSMRTVTLAAWYLSVAVGNLLVVIVTQAGLCSSQVRP
uniref:Uncharacterized protein n=1 Tax=Timema poppense TaxID=170557 RepID=A0A7R9HJS3_TIMPO|nr:unnamed protein product [Timema poppensis]